MTLRRTDSAPTVGATTRGRLERPRGRPFTGRRGGRRDNPVAQLLHRLTRWPASRPVDVAQAQDRVAVRLVAHAVPAIGGIASAS